MNAPILDHMSALSDQTRCRMLLLLERHELTVSEICAVLQMPQSSVSRHLKTLADDDWVTSRRDGTSRFYSMPADDLDSGAKRLWPLIREQVATTSSAGQDERRLKGVLARRRAKSQEFFASAAAGWDRLRQDLYGDQFYLSAVLGLIDPDLLVGDLGCGTGQLTETLAPYVRQVVAVDAETDMLDAARARLDGAITNVEFRKGELESLPVKDGELDVAVLSLVLHYSPAPAKTLAEAARVIRKGGRVLVVDMLPHEREEYRQRMGHVWPGFSAETMGGWMEEAGLTGFRHHVLPPDPDAKGPILFAATGRRRH
jgi:ArsR family transcriptional regulator